MKEGEVVILPAFGASVQVRPRCCALLHTPHAVLHCAVFLSHMSAGSRLPWLPARTVIPPAHRFAALRCAVLRCAAATSSRSPLFAHHTAPPSLLPALAGDEAAVGPQGADCGHHLPLGQVRSCGQTAGPDVPDVVIPRFGT